ncbi:hypothetical protein ILUMI_25214, partial [Ignelater luminosus]
MDSVDTIGVLRTDDSVRGALNSDKATKIQARDLQGEKVDVIRNEQKYMRGTSRYSKNTNKERGKIKDEYDCLKCGRQHSRGK